MEAIAKKYFKVVKFRVPYPAKITEGDDDGELCITAPKGYTVGSESKRYSPGYGMSFERTYWFRRMYLRRNVVG